MEVLLLISLLGFTVTAFDQNTVPPKIDREEFSERDMGTLLKDTRKR